MKKFVTIIISILMVFVLMFTPISLTSPIMSEAASTKTQTSTVSKAKKPAKVSSLSYTATTNSITLKWSKVKNASGYRVYQKSGDKWKEVKTTNAKTTSFTVKNLKAYTEYSFKVRAYTKNGSTNLWGDYSKVIKCKTKAVTKVSITSTSATKNSVTLKWGKITGATGYRVYQKKGDKWVKLADVTSCSYTAKSLKASTSYSFRIKAYKTANKKTTWYEASKTVTVKTKAASSDKATVVAKYNTAINNAKKIKNCTITDVCSFEIKSFKTSSKILNSFAGDITKDSKTNEKSTYTIKNGKDKASGRSINDFFPPEGKTSNLSVSDVASASIKKTNSGSVITIKIVSETIDFSGKEAKGGTVHKKLIGFDQLDELANYSDGEVKIKSFFVKLKSTTVTAELNSKNQLTKLKISVPIESEETVVMKIIPIKFTMNMVMTDTTTIKY